MNVRKPIIAVIGAGTLSHRQLSRPLGKWIAGRGTKSSGLEAHRDVGNDRLSGLLVGGRPGGREQSDQVRLADARGLRCAPAFQVIAAVGLGDFALCISGFRTCVEILVAFFTQLR